MVPSARSVDTKASPLSSAASATASSSVVIGLPLSDERRSEHVPTRRHRVDIAIGAERRRCWRPCAPSGRADRRRRRHRRTRADRMSPRCGKSSSTIARRPVPLGQRTHHRVLGVAEGRLRLDGHRRVVDVPASTPRRLVEIVGPAKQRDVRQTRGALPRHGLRRRQRHRLGHQVGRDVVALLVQAGQCRAHLVAVGLLRPQRHEPDHRWIKRRQTSSVNYAPRRRAH